MVLSLNSQQLYLTRTTKFRSYLFFQNKIIIKWDFFFLLCGVFFHILAPVSCISGLQNTPTASLQRGKTSPTSIRDMTLNNHCEAPVMLELWEIQSIPSFPSLPGPLRPGVIASDRLYLLVK